MSSRSTTALPVPTPRIKDRADDRGLRWAGALVVLVGAILICLAAGDALAGVEIGGRGDDTLRGSDGGDRLAGFDNADALYGEAGADTLYGGAGGDEIYGGAGRDSVLAGPGNDFIEAKDGTTDRVRCGPGKDTASIDHKDLLSPDCESIYPG